MVLALSSGTLMTGGDHAPDACGRRDRTYRGAAWRAGEGCALKAHGAGRCPACSHRLADGRWVCTHYDRQGTWDLAVDGAQVAGAVCGGWPGGIAQRTAPGSTEVFGRSARGGPVESGSSDASGQANALERSQLRGR